MARICFVTWDGGGNVPPAVGIAQSLRERGHDVRFLGYANQRTSLERRGFPFSRLERSGDFVVHPLPPPERVAGMLRHVWACPEHLQDLPAAIAAQPTDLLVVDFLMQGAMAAADLARVPSVALAHSAVAGLIPAADSPIGAPRLAAVNDLRASAGLPLLERLNDAWQRWPTVVTTIAELDPAAASAGPLVEYVGPVPEVLDQPGWQSPWAGAGEEESRRPLVLVSFSTTGLWDQRGRIRNTLAALAEEPVRVLVCGPEAESDAIGPPPANAVLRRFVPHPLVLPEAALTVTHCGHGTVTASLREGVPILGLPNKAADQPFLASRLVQLGAGLALDGEAGPEAIRAAVREILTVAGYARAARRLGESIQASPGAAGAARAIERPLGAHGR